MTIQQDDQIQLADPDDGQATWEGEPLTLVREFGDRLHHGWIPTTVYLPGTHVHPAVRQAAEQVLAAQAERVKLGQEIAARVPERDQLTQELAVDARNSGPGRVAAAHRLKDFDTETELLSILIPGADLAVRDAWDSLSAALAAYGGEWDAYLHLRGAEAVEALSEAVQTLQSALREVRLIDGLLAREGIVHQNPTTPGEIAVQFGRGQRSRWIETLYGGEDRGREGWHSGLFEIVASYRDALIPPPPTPEPAVEVDSEGEQTEVWLRVMRGASA
jgi:hypothetical protein